MKPPPEVVEELKRKMLKRIRRVYRFEHKGDLWEIDTTRMTLNLDKVEWNEYQS